MLPLRTVLCAFDDSAPATHALVAAADLAERAHATLHLVRVDPLFHAPMAHAGGADRAVMLRSRMRVSADAILGEGAFDVLDPVLHVVDSAAPVDGILATAEAVGADVVVIGTHQRRGLERLLAGSVAAEVLRRATVPVLSAPFPLTPGPDAPVLVGVDPADPSSDALAAGRALAEAFGAPLILATVRTVPPATLVGPGRHGPGGAKLSRDAAHFALDELAEAAGIAGAETHVVPGQPVPELVDLARRTRAGMLVVATHGRHGWDRRRLGSVAEGVVREAPCPVLVAPLAARPPEAEGDHREIVGFQEGE